MNRPLLVRLTQLDGKLPNLALMRLASWHRAQGDEVQFERTAIPFYWEPDYDVVYASAIFTSSARLVETLRKRWPNAIIGGTGAGPEGERLTVESITGGPWEHCDYSLYPDYAPSIGFTSRGCRFKCKFCVVPGKEGRPKAANTVADIWRGEGHPKNLHLLDNDFFGQSEDAWQARITEIRDGGFRVCFNQGVNIRVISERAAEALASVEYRDDQFARRRLYTAWDNIGDERVFFRGVERLARAGVPPEHLMAYMLVGFDPTETMERVFYRFNRMVELGIRPYPMVYTPCPDPERFELLKRFQRWVVRDIYRHQAWEDYDTSRTGRRRRKFQDIQLSFDLSQPMGAS